MYGIAVEAKDMDLKELLEWSDNVVELMRTGMSLAETEKMTAAECKAEIVRRNTELCKQNEDILKGKQHQYKDIPYRL